MNGNLDIYNINKEQIKKIEAITENVRSDTGSDFAEVVTRDAVLVSLSIKPGLSNKKEIEQTAILNASGMGVDEDIAVLQKDGLMKRVIVEKYHNKLMKIGINAKTIFVIQKAPDFNSKDEKEIGKAIEAIQNILQE